MSETRAKNRRWFGLVDKATNRWTPITTMDSEYQAVRAVGNLSYTLKRRGRPGSLPLLNLPAGRFVFRNDGPVVLARRLP